MVKQFIFTIIGVGLFSAIIMALRFGNDYSDILNILDATFIVGIITFFLGLLMFTNATQVLKSTGFVLKQRFSNKFRTKYMDFYTYDKENEKKKERITGLPILLVGLTVVIVDLIISINNYL